MEKIDIDFDQVDDELDDVLDQSYFSEYENSEDWDDDEPGPDFTIGHFRRISEL